MKFIENTIDAENLLCASSKGDLEGVMASCVSATMNGHSGKVVQGSNVAEDVTSKMSNGVASPKKLNGTVGNGFYDQVSDDDFELVLESQSSDESSSPKKKMEEETISAPQIVQEIEDLLGIDAATAGIDDELDKDFVHLDSTDSIDLSDKDEQTLVNGEVVLASQDTQEDVEEKLEENVQIIEEVSVEEKAAEEKLEEDCQINEEPSVEEKLVEDCQINEDPSVEEKLVEDCQINEDPSVEEKLVEDCEIIEEPFAEKKAVEEKLDEDCEIDEELSFEEMTVEEKMDEDSEINEEPSVEEKADVEGTAGASLAAECDSSSTLNSHVEVDKVEVDTNLETADGSVEESSPRDQIVDEIVSSSDADWEVESTTENKKRKETDNDKVQEEEDLKVRESTKVPDEQDRKISTDEEADALPSSQSSASSFEWLVTDSVGSPDDEGCKKTEKIKFLEKENQSSNLKSVEAAESTADITEDQPEENVDSTTELKEENYRKRTASVDDENSDVKKPKLEEEECNNESKSQVLKRPNPDTAENEVKRIKFVEPKSETELDSAKSNEKLKEASALPVLDINNVTEKIEKDLDCDEKNDKELDVQLDLTDINEDSVSNSEIDFENSASQVEVSEINIADVDMKVDSSEMSSSKSPADEQSEEHLEEDLQSSEIISASESCLEKNVAESKTDVVCENTTSSVETTEEVMKSDSNSENEKQNCISSTIIEEDEKDEFKTKSVKDCISTKVTVADEKCDKKADSENKDCTSTSIEDTKASYSNTADKTGSENGFSESNKMFLFKVDKKLDKSVKLDKTVQESSDIIRVRERNRLPSPEIISIDLEDSPSKQEIKKAKVEDNEVNKEDVLTSAKPKKKTVAEDRKVNSMNSKSPFEMLLKNMEQVAAKSKNNNKMDVATENDSDKAKTEVIPLIKRFHKENVKKLTRSELEEMAVLTMCEAITNRSELGQLRQRYKSLEEEQSVWRKRQEALKKQIRELEMVVKRYLGESKMIRGEDAKKALVPVKITRSVGLQVVLASSVQGGLQATKSQMQTDMTAANEANKQRQQQLLAQRQQQQLQQQQQQQKLQQQQQQKLQQHHQQKLKQQLQQQQQKQLVKQRLVEREMRDKVRSTTFTPPVPVQSAAPPAVTSKPRGRPPKQPPSAPPTPQPSSTPKPSPPPTPAKPSTHTPVKTATPSKDLEVIDLTEKDERAKSSPQNPAAGGQSIRVSPSTQVCIVQTSVPTSAPQQMAYIVQKAGARQQQFLVATTSASPQKTTTSNAGRPPPGLASLPAVFRTGGQLIPVQTGAQVAVRGSSTAMSTSTPRPASQATIRPQTSLNKHPAPLPAAATTVAKPGIKNPPTKPELKIAKTVNGIMLSWSMKLTKDMSEIASYQLYAYQEGSQPPTTSLWKKVGDVKALPLPMACTLTQFIPGHKYHFAVRAVDIHNRIGPFSQPSSIMLTR